MCFLEIMFEMEIKANILKQRQFEGNIPYLTAVITRHLKVETFSKKVMYFKIRRHINIKNVQYLYSYNDENMFNNGLSSK